MKKHRVKAPSCPKVKIPYFIRLMTLIKGMFCVFFILIWRTVALQIQFSGNKAMKIHQWIELLTRINLVNLLENSTCFLSYMMICRWLMLSVPKITCFYIFSKESVLKIYTMFDLINKQRAGFELSYKSSFTKIQAKWSQTSDPYYFFRLFCWRIFGIFKHFCFAKVKIHFTLYELRNDNSNPGRTV